MNKPIQVNQQGSFKWREPYVIAMLVYYLAMAAIGIWTPENILKDNPGAREFSNLMASIVPQIDRITALNIKSDVNRFYFSVLWAGSPAFFGICSLYIWSTRTKGYSMWTLPFIKVPVYIGCYMLIILWAQMLWRVDPNMGLSKWLFSNPIGRGLQGQIVFNTASVFGAAGSIVWLYGWISGYIPRNIQARKVMPVTNDKA